MPSLSVTGAHLVPEELRFKVIASKGYAGPAYQLCISGATASAFTTVSGLSHEHLQALADEVLRALGAAASE